MVKRMTGQMCLLGSLGLGVASCAVSFPDYTLGAGGHATTSTTSTTNTSVSGSSSTLGTSSSSGCGDTTMSTTNCGMCGHACGTMHTTKAACDASACVLTCDVNYTQCSDSETQGCVNLMTSSTDCGKCGHDCGGGLCSMGVCQPNVIATGLTGVDAIALDKDRIYWSTYKDPTSLHALPKSTIGLTMPTTIPINAPTGVTNLITDGAVALFGATPANASTLYFTTSTSGTFRMAADGSGVIQHIGTTCQSGAMAVEGPYVFWTDGCIGGEVNRYDTGANTQLVFGVGETYSAITSIAIDATNVYWGEDGGNGGPIGIYDTAISGAACAEMGGTTPCVHFETTPTPGLLSQDSNNIYWWADGTPYGIFKASKTTKAITQLANTGSDVDGLVTDGINVYWIENKNYLYSVPVGTTTVCATGQCTLIDGEGTGEGSLIEAIAIDDQAVYWQHNQGPNPGVPNTAFITRLVK